MRIISQDGLIDVPYEKVVIQRFKERIYFLNKNLTGVEQLIDDMEMATYSTEAKAIKAMEMLREAYIQTEEFNGGYDMNDCYVSPQKWVLPKVFQFPKDENVEV